LIPDRSPNILDFGPHTTHNVLAFAFAEAVYIARGEHDPQASIPSRQQIPDSFSREIFSGSRLKTREPDAVERKQAGPRSEPQISVVESSANAAVANSHMANKLMPSRTERDAHH